MTEAAYSSQRDSASARSGRTEDPVETIGRRRRQLRRNVLMGAVVAVVFVGGALAWGALAPLSSAAVASGTVSHTSGRYRVDHLDGGMVQEVLIHEGAEVAAGDIVMVLSSPTVESRAGVQRKRLRATAAEVARLEALLADRSDVAFTHPVLSDGSEQARALRRSAQARYATDRELAEREVEILHQRIRQLRAQIAGRERQIESLQKSAGYLDREINAVQSLVDKGFASVPRLLKLKRERVDVERAIAELDTKISEAREGIAELDLQILKRESERNEEAEGRLAELRQKLASTEGELAASMDQLDRNLVKAPVSGTVINLRVETTGSVLRAGDTMFEIVPSDRDVVVDVRIRPTDIDDVFPGQSATVVFSALPAYGQERLEGRLETISADVKSEEQSDERYYSASVHIPRAEMQRLGDLLDRIKPGMPADVFLSTGEQTFLDYLIKPIRRTIEKSLTES